MQQIIAAVKIIVIYIIYNVYITYIIDVTYNVYYFPCKGNVFFKNIKKCVFQIYNTVLVSLKEG